MALSPRLLLAASKLYEIAEDGVVELPAVELKAALGLRSSTVRTLRNLLADLEEANALTRSSGRGPGAMIRLVLTEKRKEAERKAESSGKEAEVAEKAETGRGRGGVTRTSTAQRESAAASEQARATEKRKVAEKIAEVAESVVRHEHVVRLEATPELLAALGLCVSRSKNESQPGGASPPRPATAPDGVHGAGIVSLGSGPAERSGKVARSQSDPQGLVEWTPEAQIALEHRVEQQRKIGFKKTEAAFRKHMKRELLKKPHEVKELLDEKREIEEAKGRPPAPSVGPPGPPAAPAEQPGSRQALEALRARQGAREAQATRARMLESSAALRGAKT